MNLIGMGLFVKGLKELDRHSGGGGGRYGYRKDPTEEDYFYEDCMAIIRECVKMPEMEDSVIPVTTSKKRTWKEKRKGKAKEETAEIYIAQINPRGVKFPGIDVHTGLSPVIGTIDDKMFVYSTNPERLEIFTIEEYSYDHMGDYMYRTGNVLDKGIDSNFDEIRMSSKIYSSAQEVRPGVSRTIKHGQTMFTANDNWIKVAEVVGQKRKEYKRREVIANHQELGE